MTTLVLKNNDLIDVSYRSVNFGFIFPVLIDKKIWNDHYIDYDAEMRWLEGILNACACALNSNQYQLDSKFDYKREGEVNTTGLQSSLEFDENITPYVLIKYRE